MIFKEVYKLPLKVDENCPIITWTANKQRAFDWCVDVSSEKQQELIDVINGTKQHQFKHKFYREGIEIYSENPIFKGPILRIRGWGYLTGISALHLSQEEAVRIQNEFGDYIVEQLNKNHKTFEEFQNEVLDYAYNHKPVKWRYGQAVFNYIDEHYNVARQVQFIDKVDCFYNDDIIDQFILLSWKRVCGGL